MKAQGYILLISSIDVERIFELYLDPQVSAHEFNISPVRVLQRSN